MEVEEIEEQSITPHPTPYRSLITASIIQMQFLPDVGSASSENDDCSDRMSSRSTKSSRQIVIEHSKFVGKKTTVKHSFVLQIPND